MATLTDVYEREGLLGIQNLIQALLKEIEEKIGEMNKKTHSDGYATIREAYNRGYDIALSDITKLLNSYLE